MTNRLPLGNRLPIPVGGSPDGCFQYCVFDTQWTWMRGVEDMGTALTMDIMRWRRHVIHLLIPQAPVHPSSLLCSALRFLANTPGGRSSCDLDRCELRALEHCMAVVPWSVLLERPVATFLLDRPPLVPVYLDNLRDVPVHQWRDHHLTFLVRNMHHLPAFDAFVWSVFFRPDVPTAVHRDLLSVHPTSGVPHHWCHYLRLHATLPHPPVRIANVERSDGTKREPPASASPLQRFLRNVARPGDLALVLDGLVGVDNPVARRWVANASGENTASLPWESVVGWIVGKLVAFARQSGIADTLSTEQQRWMIAQLLAQGHKPQSAAWFLAAMIYHADDLPLREACHHWWWAHGCTTLLQLTGHAVVLVPCMLRLAQRCRRMTPVEVSESVEQVRTVRPWDGLGGWDMGALAPLVVHTLVDSPRCPARIDVQRVLAGPFDFSRHVSVAGCVCVPSVAGHCHPKMGIRRVLREIRPRGVARGDHGPR